MSPWGRRSMPRSVPRITLSDGLAASESAFPADGAFAIGSQLTPPLGEEKISFCSAGTVGLPELLGARQARIRSLAFTAPSSAPVGWLYALAGPAPQAAGSEPTRGQDPLPSTGPAYSAPSGASRSPRLPAGSPVVAAPTGEKSSSAAGEE